MNVPKQTWINTTGGKNLSEIVLPSFTDILMRYNQLMIDEQQHGITLTDDMLEQIDKIQ